MTADHKNRRNKRTAFHRARHAAQDSTRHTTWPYQSPFTNVIFIDLTMCNDDYSTAAVTYESNVALSVTIYKSYLHRSYYV